MPPHRLAGREPIRGRRPRRRRAVPGCRCDRRRPRTTTSPDRSAGATVEPAARWSSRSRAARRESRCRGSARGIPARQRRGRRDCSCGCRRRVDRARRVGDGRRSTVLLLPAEPRCRSAGVPRSRRAVSRRRDWRQRFAGGLREQPLFGGWRPPPRQIDIGIAADAVGADHHEPGARDHDRDDQRRAPRPAPAGHARRPPRPPAQGTSPGGR